MPPSGLAVRVTARLRMGGSGSRETAPVSARPMVIVTESDPGEAQCDGVTEVTTDTV